MLKKFENFNGWDLENSILNDKIIEFRENFLDVEPFIQSYNIYKSPEEDWMVSNSEYLVLDTINKFEIYDSLFNQHMIRVFSKYLKNNGKLCFVINIPFKTHMVSASLSPIRFNDIDDIEVLNICSGLRRRYNIFMDMRGMSVNSASLKLMLFEK